LLDTGIFDDDRYFDVFVEYAKAGPDDILMLVTAHNRGPEAFGAASAAAAWFRNTWSWKPGAASRNAGMRNAIGAIMRDWARISFMWTAIRS
jgi:hypothetical protein